MDVRRFESGAELLAAAGHALAAREAENSLVLGFAHSDRAFEGCELGLAAFSRGRPAAVLIQTGINEAIVSTAGARAAAALGRGLAAAAPDSRGIVGPAAPARAAAEGFASATRDSVRIERELILHQLQAEPPAPAGGERLRRATARDAALLLAWAAGFEQDTRTPDHARNAARRVHQGIESGRLYLLEAGAAPCAAASWGRPTVRTRTVTCVYTPPEERGQGRGRAITSLLATRLLREGAQTVLIFTDADDPVPNHVYERVGFRRLAAFSHLAFVRSEGLNPLL